MFKFKLKSIAAVVIVLFVALPIFAKSSQSFSRTYHEQFAVNPDVLFKVNNKYGFVKIVTNNTNEIIVDVKVSIDAASQDKADKLLDRITISIMGDASEVTAITEIEKNSKFKDLSIDYTISMPVSGRLDAINKFGDFYLNELNGSAEVYVGYGALEIGDLNSQNNKVTVKYGSGKINYAKYLTGLSRYSKMRVDRAKLLDMNSQYGELRIGEVGRLILKSAYEDIEIGTVVELEANVRFGDMEIDGIMGKFICDAQYGDIEVSFISKDFTVVELEADFGDAELTFENGSNFTLNAKASFGDVNMPNGTINTVSGGDLQSYEVQTTNTETPSKVFARMSYGDLDISIY